MKIPVFSLERQNKQLAPSINKAVNEVVRRGIFILGEKVSELEREYAKYLGVSYAVGVASGTDALSLAMLAVGVEPGDEVIMPANSYPSVFAVTAIRAIPRLVDIEPATFNIDPLKIEKVITKKTKAVLAVHLYGQAADLSEIKRVLKNYNRKIYLIEDCAQAHGALYCSDHLGNLSNLGNLGDQNKKRWKKVGTVGDVSCFSFYPTKNLGCFGDGGMVVTNNKDIYDKVKLLRMYGEKKRYQSILLGRNSRLDELQAAVLLVKLRYLDKWNKRRREIAKQYYHYLYELTDDYFSSQEKFSRSATRLSGRSGSPSDLRKFSPAALKNNIFLPVEMEYARHVYHLFVIRTNRRDKLKDYLQKKGIQTAIHYPKPIHLQPAFSYLGYKKGDFPESERASREVLSLPMFPELKNREVTEVSKNIVSFENLL